jgi:hypothetical protein
MPRKEVYVWKSIWNSTERLFYNVIFIFIYLLIFLWSWCLNSRHCTWLPSTVSLSHNPSSFCFQYIFQLGSPLLSGAGLVLQSSYICLPGNWNCRYKPPCLASVWSLNADLWQTITFSLSATSLYYQYPSILLLSRDEKVGMGLKALILSGRVTPCFKWDMK